MNLFDENGLALGYTSSVWLGHGHELQTLLNKNHVLKGNYVISISK